MDGQLLILFESNVFRDVGEEKRFGRENVGINSVAGLNTRFRKLITTSHVPPKIPCYSAQLSFHLGRGG